MKNILLFIIVFIANSAYADLWSKVKENFKINSVLNTDIQTQILYLSQHPQSLEASLENARPYLHFILSEVNKRHLPAELALLPVIESKFDASVYSPKAAAGLWQFMPKTGSHFGLKQNSLYDGRQDLVLSTRAALDYLEDLYKEFDYDWLKALAAYNAGSGRVKNAIKINKKRGKLTSFWALSLPKETTTYVPKLLALKEIIKNPKKYGITLPYIQDETYLIPIEIPSNVDLLQLVSIYNINWEEFKGLNPAFKKQHSPTHTSFIVLPIEPYKIAIDRYESKEAYQSVLQKVVYQANLNTNIKTKTAVQKDYYMIYTVKPNDTLWKISQHYKINIHDIKRWNQIGDSIIIGQKLFLKIKVSQK